jgi:hypothetical protein
MIDFECDAPMIWWTFDDFVGLEDCQEGWFEGSVFLGETLPSAAIRDAQISIDSPESWQGVTLTFRKGAGGELWEARDDFRHFAALEQIQLHTFGYSVITEMMRGKAYSLLAFREKWPKLTTKLTAHATWTLSLN